MKRPVVKYYPEDDVLYIEVKDTLHTDSATIADDITVSWDAEGDIAAIEMIGAADTLKPLVDAARSGEDLGRALRKTPKSA